ncbi:MAG: hypothetical protein E7642_07285 [Ruminococcaceae bacterium]|nr:hypothetical protein [Oscillospiraceae bacterium]
MKVTFCGHSSFIATEKDKVKILEILEKEIGEAEADILLGGYGSFDEFAYLCCKEYKNSHPKVSLVFVTPYLSEEYQKNHLSYQNMRYDSIIYPPIEDKLPRFAILYRNRYMVENSDIVIAYVFNTYGGAYTTYKYAKAKKKRIFNLANI